MRTSTRAIAAIAACLAASTAIACGVCDEDRVAAVFDSATVDRAVAAHRHVAFFAIAGDLPATAQSRRAVLDALYASGGMPGTARVSLESSSASAAFDPAKTTLAAFQARTGQRLAQRGLTLSALRVVEGSGELRAP
jgi:hypothetical protein